MPPKADAKATIGVDPAVGVLINLIRTADEFKPNMSKMAGPCGIAQAKNVPRKIDSVLRQHGFKLVSGNILAIDEDDPGIKKEIKQASAEGGASEEDQKPGPKTPSKTTQKRTASTKEPRSTSAKKRKHAADDVEKSKDFKEEAVDSKDDIKEDKVVKSEPDKDEDRSVTEEGDDQVKIKRGGHKVKEEDEV